MGKWRYDKETDTYVPPQEGYRYQMWIFKNEERTQERGVHPMLNKLMRKFFGWYIDRIIAATIERCAQVCEGNEYEAEKMYWMLREVATYPDSDIGVLKYACYSGQSGRDASDIRKLENGQK